MLFLPSPFIYTLLSLFESLFELKLGFIVVCLALVSFLLATDVS
jgi:hypothetical protein